MSTEQLPAFELASGETIMWVRPGDKGGYTLRVRANNGVESMHDVYPGQAAPDVDAFLAEQAKS